MRYMSLFSGICAATVAWKPLGWTPVAFAEIEKFPSAVLAHHYGSNMPGEPHSKNGVPNYGDVTKYKEWPNEPVDLICGGSPCQSFSVAGLRKGMDDPRGNLALVYLGIVDKYRPKWVVYENVPGLLSSNGGRDFGSILGGLVQLGYGVCYRVLDAQYVRVDGFGRAVPQRRRRVFVVGYLGDWRRAAAVLLEPEGMRGDPPPRRQTGQAVAPTIASRPSGGGGLGTDFDLDGGLIADGYSASGDGFWREGVGPLRARAQDSHESIVVSAFGGGNTSSALDVSTALTAHGVRMDFEVETFIAEVSATLNAGGNETGGERQPGTTADTAGSMLVAKKLKKEDVNVIAFNPKVGGNETIGKSYLEDGSSYTLDTDCSSVAVAYGFEDRARGDDGRGYDRAPHFSKDLSSTLGTVKPPAVAFDMRGREGGAQFEGPHETANIRAGSGGSSRSYVAQQWAVRRLTPTECHRLQGFPDGFCNIPWRGKDFSPDGPQYKALGNSMAVNVMRWIGTRIQMVEDIIREVDV